MPVGLDLTNLLPRSPTGIALAISLLALSYLVSYVVFNLFFHPLRKFPGPASSRASPLAIISHSIKGDVVQWITELHRIYGPVVRLSPGELSFSGADAYKDIYGHKKAGLPTLEKAPVFYRSPFGEIDIINGDFNTHARMRRIFSHAFSDRALKLQESLFTTYVDVLISKLRETVSKNPAQQFNMVRMYNFTTFDIMGDLAFGEPLDMLNNNEYTPWVAAMFAGFKFGAYLHCMRYLGQIDSFLLKYCMPKSLMARVNLHKELSMQRVDRRIEAQKDGARPDIWGLVLEREGDKGMSREEMYSNANIFMIAGTETTATLLSGLTYYLLTNPDKLKKLTAELRSAFVTEEDITIEKMASLKYLNACVEEGLRMYPPVAPGLPRMTPPGPSTTIDGYQVPPDTKVLVTNFAANRNTDTWRDAYSFIPERWLTGSPEGAPYANDKRHGFQPFSTGPRACLGKNMAYHEIRIILTKVLFNFDLTLCKESKTWNQQKLFIMWDKPALMVQLKPVEGGSGLEKA